MALFVRLVLLSLKKMDLTDLDLIGEKKKSRKGLSRN
jgi:hypothetical protein